MLGINETPQSLSLRYVLDGYFILRQRLVSFLRKGKGVQSQHNVLVVYTMTFTLQFLINFKFTTTEENSQSISLFVGADWQNAMN